MNKKVLILVIALAVVAAGAVIYFKVLGGGSSSKDGLLVPTAAADVYEDSNRLEVNEGSVTVTRASGEEEEVTDETTVDMGDTIVVSADGKATLYWFDNSISRLAAGTEMKIDQAAYNPENINETDISFEVVGGEVWSKVQAIVEEDSEFLSYSGGVVAGVRGSVFNFAVEGDEVVVDSIAHAMTIGEDTLVTGEQASFKKESGEQLEKKRIPAEAWDRPWFKNNLERDRADQQRMKAAMMERLRNAIGALPGEPGFMEKVRKLDEFMKSDASPEEKRAVEAKIIALVRAMDALPSDKTFAVKAMLQEKLLEWEQNDERREYMIQKRIERRLYTLQDWIAANDPSPEELRAYMAQFKDVMGAYEAFFEENPELAGLFEDAMKQLQEQLPELLNSPEFLRFKEMMENGEFEFDPAIRSAPIWNVDPDKLLEEANAKLEEAKVELEKIELLDVPITTEPRDVIKMEAPFYQGESNV